VIGCAAGSSHAGVPKCVVTRGGVRTRRALLAAHEPFAHQYAQVAYQQQHCGDHR